MSVKYEHPQYVAMLPKWQRCRDTASGQDAVHAAGATYLPMLSEQENEDYKAYKLRATFFNATWRTIVGLQGMIFRKPPKTFIPEVLNPMMDNVTMSGKSFHVFSLEVVEEALSVGRVGILTDYPVATEDIVTAADAIKKNLRPSMQMYHAEAIINWKRRTILNKTVLCLVVLKECNPVPKDEFEDNYVTQYRVLDLIDMLTPEGIVKQIYRVRVIEVVTKDGKEIENTISEVFPKVKNEPLDHIPFIIMGTDDVSPEVDEPPMIDLVDMNIAHYRVSADYEHGCHFTGLPTPVISGYTPETVANGKGQSFYIGSRTAWIFPNPAAKATFLEFTGQGLKELASNLATKVNEMAVLGARMLEAQIQKTESANTASIHRSGEQSMLASIAQVCSIGLSAALTDMALFAGTDEPAKCELNKDFFPAPMDALMITALIAGWQNGAISYDSLLEKLKDGEIVDPEATVESELAKIKANPAPVVNAPTTPGNVENQNPKTAASGTGKDPTITQMQHGTQ